MNSAGNIWKSPENLTISEVRDATEALCALVRSEGDIEIDLRPVEDIDTAGVQLLVALRRSVERAGKSLRIHANHNGALQKTLIGLGLLTAEGTTRSAGEQLWAGYIEEGATPA